jgi:hypothetical protein
VALAHLCEIGVVRQSATMQRSENYLWGISWQEYSHDTGFKMLVFSAAKNESLL